VKNLKAETRAENANKFKNKININKSNISCSHYNTGKYVVSE